MPASKRAPSGSQKGKAAYSPIDIETKDYSIVATAPDTLSMTCPATSEGVLKLFSNPILVHEVEKNPHIESQFHVVGKNFEIEFKADASTVKKIVSFDALKHANLTDDIKVAAHERKFFVRNAHSMKDYIVKLKKGIITHYTHRQLFGAVAGFVALTGAAFLLNGKMRDYNGKNLEEKYRQEYNAAAVMIQKATRARHAKARHASLLKAEDEVARYGGAMGALDHITNRIELDDYTSTRNQVGAKMSDMLDATEVAAEAAKAAMAAAAAKAAKAPHQRSQSDGVMRRQSAGLVEGPRRSDRLSAKKK
jgi:hypothetical protein